MNITQTGVATISPITFKTMTKFQLAHLFRYSLVGHGESTILYGVDRKGNDGFATYTAIGFILNPQSSAIVQKFGALGIIGANGMWQLRHVRHGYDEQAEYPWA